MASVRRAFACAVVAALDDDEFDAVFAVLAWFAFARFAFARFEAVRV